MVGDDTDLLVLLCYHASLDSHSLYFRPEARRNSKCRRIWHIQSVKKQLGPQVCDHILFLHAILGYDTTSRLNGIGKGNALKKFREGGQFCEVAEVFNLSSASKEDIAVAGEEALITLYHGKCEVSLDSLRYKHYCSEVASNTAHVQPHTLPPTSAAAKNHSFRDSSGREERLLYCLKIGVGKKVMAS